VEAQGRASAFAALHRAAKDLLAGEVDVALVGGVDSLVRPASLERLEAKGILRTASHPEGILPGEAAAFAVVERAERAGGRRVLCRIASIAFAEEPTAGTDRPNQAKALSAVFRRIRDNDPGIRERALSICDLNGDRARAMEWSMASIRVLGDLQGDQPIWHAADCIGDVGAASGALALVWGGIALDQGYAGANAVLAWGASDGPLRGAALLVPSGRPSPRTPPSMRTDRAHAESASWA
jgi:3-oxoacyl-[acyl-carrier-protein] synthase-1